MTLKGQGRDPIMFETNISKTAGDTHLVTMEDEKEMGYGKSNGHMTDDVTWPQKIKVVSQI